VLAVDGVLYFSTPDNAWAVDADPRGAMGLGGKEETGLGSMGAYLTAIDYKTGKVAWQHRYPGTGGGLGNGVLSTAGNSIAYDPANGKIVWHTRLGQVSNAHQYILIAAGDALYAFTLY
jgi:alcohol dehydrogenase (cytochrome c)